MFAQLARWFQPSPEKEASHRLYIALVTQARQPFFYTSLEVKDTLDGRFDMILLHLFMVNHRLKAAKEEHTDTLALHLIETFITDMDRSLREIGIGDTGVAKRIKKMGQALNGRLTVYEQALDEKTLKDAIKRNLFRERDVTDETLDAYEAYIEQALLYLESQSTEGLADGELSWPNIKETVAA